MVAVAVAVAVAVVVVAAAAAAAVAAVAGAVATAAAVAEVAGAVATAASAAAVALLVVMMVGFFFLTSAFGIPASLQNLLQATFGCCSGGFMTSSRFGSTVSRRAVVDYGLAGALKLWEGRSTNRLLACTHFVHVRFRLSFPRLFHGGYFRPSMSGSFGDLVPPLLMSCDFLRETGTCM